MFALLKWTAGHVVRCVAAANQGGKRRGLEFSLHRRLLLFSLLGSCETEKSVRTEQGGTAGHLQSGGGDRKILHSLSAVILCWKPVRQSSTANKASEISHVLKLIRLQQKSIYYCSQNIFCSFQKKGHSLLKAECSISLSGKNGYNNYIPNSRII